MASSMHIIREKKLWTGLPVLSTTTTVIVVVGLRFLVTSFGASIDELSESLGLSRSRALALSPALSQLPAPRCPDSCEDILSQLKDGPRGTGKFQSVDIQLRGEPKSGTGMSQVRRRTARYTPSSIQRAIALVSADSSVLTTLLCLSLVGT